MPKPQQNDQEPLKVVPLPQDERHVAAPKPPADDIPVYVPMPKHNRTVSNTETENEDFIRRLIEARTADAVRLEPAPAPARTKQQKSQLDLEMEAGKKAVACAQAVIDAAPKRPKPKDTTRIFAPEEYMHEKGNASKEHSVRDLPSV